jgi:hypothetical protein
MSAIGTELTRRVVRYAVAIGVSVGVFLPFGRGNPQ